MSSEGRLTFTTSIRKTSGSLITMDERESASFIFDVTGTKGPTPGDQTIPVGGKVISLGELSTPGLCVVKNRSASYYISIGIRDPDTNKFYPFLELLPGMSLPLYLSRDILEEYQGTGTGTTGPGNQLFAKAIGGDAVMYIGAFER